jgi:hypothetical protein
MTLAICFCSARKSGYARSVAGLLADTQRQRLDGLQQRPGVERRHGRAGVAEIVLEVLLDPFLARKYNAVEGEATVCRYAWVAE